MRTLTQTQNQTLNEMLFGSPLKTLRKGNLVNYSHRLARQLVAEATRRVILKRAIRRRLTAIGLGKFLPNMSDWNLHKLKDFARWLAAPRTLA